MDEVELEDDGTNYHGALVVNVTPLYDAYLSYDPASGDGFIADDEFICEEHVFCGVKASEINKNN